MNLNPDLNPKEKKRRHHGHATLLLVVSLVLALLLLLLLVVTYWTASRKFRFESKLEPQCNALNVLNLLANE